MSSVKNLEQGKIRNLPLFEEMGGEASSISGNGSTAFSDPAFASNKALPIHRWIPWIAGFSSDLVREVIIKYLDNPGTVLDPFAGVGTTLVEAALMGHTAIGFEINPYAVLACRVKLEAPHINIKTLEKEFARFQAFYKNKQAGDHTPDSTPPHGFKTRADFYSPKVLHKVLIIQDFIASIEDVSIQNVFKLTFASTMVRYSNYSYEPSLTRRISSGKAEITDFAVDQAMVNKLAEIVEDIMWFQERLPEKNISFKTIIGSFLEYQKYLAPESVDLIVTSPPYLNNYHYIRNTRPQLYWLGYAEQPQDLKYLEQANFGKYWQTVRDQKCLGLEFSLPDTDITERLQELRRLHPEKGIYGGNGWANYAASYFNDCRKFAMGIFYTLKPGSTAVIVMGNSILQGILIPTDQYFAKIAQSVGLELVRLEIPRTKRVGNSIIQSEVRVAKAQDSHQLYEAIVELKKP